MLTSVPGHSLSILNGKFLMKSCVMNALKIVIVDFLKEYLLNLECLKSVPGHSLPRPLKKST